MYRMELGPWQPGTRAWAIKYNSHLHLFSNIQPEDDFRGFL